MSKIKVIAYYRTELLLCAITLLIFSILEICHPYFFLQDDNRTAYLPYFLHNLRALSGGELPFFNFHQYLGTPVSFLAAPFYPLNYVAMLLSKLFLGNYFGTMEIIAGIHLLIASIGFYRFARQFGLEEFSCCFGAIAWTFSAFVITVGNSWIHTVSFAAYIPWILLFSIRQMYAFSRRSFFLLASLKLLAFLIGYPQWFIYTATFDLLLVAAIYIAEKRGETSDGSVSTRLCSPVKFVLRYCSNYFLFFVMALPVILQLLHESGASAERKNILSWSEYVSFSFDLKLWLHGLVMPFIDSGLHHFGELQYISHIGYLTLIFIIVAFTQVRDSRVVIIASLATMSLLWSADIIFTNFFYYLPFYNKLRIPFKLQFFTGFFLVTLATFGLNSFLSRLKKGSGRVFGYIVAVVLLLQVANYLVLYGIMPQKMLANHLDRPPFSEPLQDLLTGGRIVSAGLDVLWAGEIAVPEFSVPTLGYNYATLWGLYHFGGYEGLLSEKNLSATLGLKNNSIYNVAPDTVLNIADDIPLTYFRKWGVKWYVINSRIPLAGTEGLKLIHSDKFRNVLHDPAGSPFVLWADGRNANVPEFNFRTNSVEIMTKSENEGLLKVNVLYNPYFHGYLDDKEIPVEETEDGQMSVAVPAGSHKVRLKYIDSSFRNGLLVSAVSLFFCVVLWTVMRFRKDDTK